MVSKLTKEHDRRTLLANYLYGVSNLFITGVGIGGFSPLITNQEMNIYNYLSVTGIQEPQRSEDYLHSWKG